MDEIWDIAALAVQGQQQLRWLAWLPAIVVVAGTLWFIYSFIYS